MKMVTSEELEQWLDGYLDARKIQDYLPNGLQVEGKREVCRLITAVSINREVIEKAIDLKADAILVHHGMFWKSDDPVIRYYRKDRIKALLDNEINLFAYHLPLDLHPEISHNRIILNGVGADEITMDAAIPESIPGLKGKFKPPISFEEFIERVNRFLKTKARYFNYGSNGVEAVYVVSGAGRTLFETVLKGDVDLYLTGDAQENTRYIASEMHINYVFAGHYATERPGIIALGEKVHEELGIEVTFIDVENEL